jgi:hypothetical protein
MLNVIMLNVIMLSVIMLSVVGPCVCLPICPFSINYESVMFYSTGPRECLLKGKAQYVRPPDLVSLN